MEARFAATLEFEKPEARVAIVEHRAKIGREKMIKYSLKIKLMVVICHDSLVVTFADT